MSYSPSHKGAVNLLGQPNALIWFDVVTNGTCSVGSLIEYTNPQVKYGSWSGSISSGVITLPSGYWYFLEGTTQFYPLDDFYDHTLETQWYDATNSQYIGLKTLMAPQITEQDDQPTTRPDTARALIDCTSSGIDVKNVIIATGESTAINKTGTTQAAYGSLGRCVIWQLSA